MAPRWPRLQRAEKMESVCLETRGWRRPFGGHRENVGLNFSPPAHGAGVQTSNGLPRFSKNRTGISKAKFLAPVLLHSLRSPRGAGQRRGAGRRPRVRPPGAGRCRRSGAVLGDRVSKQNMHSAGDTAAPPHLPHAPVPFGPGPAPRRAGGRSAPAAPAPAPSLAPRGTLFCKRQIFARWQPDELLYRESG